MSGAYTFATESDDGVRLWINNQQVINNWTDHGATTNTSAPITLTAGVSYDVRLEFYDRTGGAIIRLLWSYPGQSQVIIPQSALFPPGANLPPTLNAGPDQTIALPAPVSLAGAASDDGRPTPPGHVDDNVEQGERSRHGHVRQCESADHDREFLGPGTYIIRLNVFDGALTSTDDATITVNPSGQANQAPIVNAGADQTITLPASASLSGMATDDGLPTPPAAITTTWSKVSGPGTVTFGNASLLSTSAIMSAAGTYVLRLSVFDGALTTTDDLSVAVNPAVPVNQAPTVNTGVDQTITLPANATLIRDRERRWPARAAGLLTKTWSMVSGPGTVGFSSTLRARRRPFRQPVHMCCGSRRLMGHHYD